MFREVRVYEIREVLRLGVLGEGLRSIERLSSVDRKTVRRSSPPPPTPVSTAAVTCAFDKCRMCPQGQPSTSTTYTKRRPCEDQRGRR